MRRVEASPERPTASGGDSFTTLLVGEGVRIGVEARTLPEGVELTLEVLVRGFPSPEPAGDRLGRLSALASALAGEGYEAGFTADGWLHALRPVTEGEVGAEVERCQELLRRIIPPGLLS